MNRSFIDRLILAAAFTAGIFSVPALDAQNAVKVGKGSYAEYPPMFVSHKAGDTDNYVEGNRGVSHFMQSRKLWIRERENQPLPSNNWWMSLVVSAYSDKMWSYPQWIQATERGVGIHFATYWIDNGTEMKSNTMVKVGGLNFSPDCAIAEKWNDWDVAFSESDGNKQMYVTQAHGSRLPISSSKTSCRRCRSLRMRTMLTVRSVLRPPVSSMPTALTLFRAPKPTDS